jgi:transcriptional regulator with XRE-family HTH domain
MKNDSRTRLKRLSEKLLRIRLELGFSQNGMLEHLGFSEELFRSNISQYELGTREPPLPVLLQYARSANIYVDVLLDDNLTSVRHKNQQTTADSCNCSLTRIFNDGFFSRQLNCPFALHLCQRPADDPGLKIEAIPDTAGIPNIGTGQINVNFYPAEMQQTLHEVVGRLSLYLLYVHCSCIKDFLDARTQQM